MKKLVDQIVWNELDYNALQEKQREYEALCKISALLEELQMAQGTDMEDFKVLCKMGEKYMDKAYGLQRETVRSIAFAKVAVAVKLYKQL
jgi:hypothetical protein